MALSRTLEKAIVSKPFIILIIGIQVKPERYELHKLPQMLAIWNAFIEPDVNLAGCTDAFPFFGMSVRTYKENENVCGWGDKSKQSI